MCMMSIGRFQELYKKCNDKERPHLPAIYQIIYRELSNLLKLKRNPNGTLFSLVDVHEITSSIRELNLFHVDNLVIKELVNDT